MYIPIWLTMVGLELWPYISHIILRAVKNKTFIIFNLTFFLKRPVVQIICKLK